MAGAVARKLCLGHSVFPFPGSDAGVVPFVYGRHGQGRHLGALRRERLSAGPPERMRGWPACSDGTGTVTGNRLGGGRMQCRQSRDRGSVSLGVKPAVIGG